MLKSRYSNQEIAKKAKDLMLKYVECTPQQKLNVISEREKTQNSLSSKLVQKFCALETMSRYILVNNGACEDRKSRYIKYKDKSLDHLVKGVRRIYPDKFTHQETKLAIKGFIASTLVRNLLVHEFAFIDAGMARQLYMDADTVHGILKGIIETMSGCK